MNQNDDVELLDGTNKASNNNVINSSTVNNTSPSVVNNTNVSNTNQSTLDADKSEKSNISPLVEKPVISGTTANSPRIDAFDTMAKGKDMHTPKVHIPEDPSKLGQEKPVDKVETNTTNEQQSNGKKPIWLILLFVVMLVIIIGLPYSQDLFSKLFPDKTDEEIVEEPSSGNLICTLENDDNGVVYQYTENYSFTNKVVDTLEHTVLVQGDADLLNTRNAQCEQLKQISSDMEGVTISCDIAGGEVEEVQFFNLLNFDSKQISTEFTEAGGVIPSGLNNEKYKEVKKTLEMSGYECEVE